MYLKNYNLKNKTAVVTGGSQGFGYAISKRLYDSGAKIVNIDIDTKANAEAKAKNEINFIDIFEVDITNFKEVNNTKLIGKSFNKSGDFDIASNHFDTLNRENTTTSNIAEEITEEISRYLILYFKN